MYSFFFFYLLFFPFSFFSLFFPQGEEDSDSDDPLADRMEEDNDTFNDSLAMTVNPSTEGISTSSTDMSSSSSSGSLLLNVRDIDAYWLQREVAKFYTDANESQKMEGQILEILEEIIDNHDNGEDGMDGMDTRTLENDLFLLLDVVPSDVLKVQFIKTVTHGLNPYIITYCIRLNRSNTIELKNSRKENMKLTSQGREVLEMLENMNRGTDAKDWAKDKERRAVVGNVTTIEGEDTNDPDSISSSSLSSQPSSQQQQQQQQNMQPKWNAPLRTVDLDSLSFNDGSRFMASKKIQLPEGTWRAQKKGYEEYHIPAVTFKADPDDTTKIVSIQNDMPVWSRSAFGKITHLNRMQSICSEVAFRSPENLLVCAPTGAGKTNVACLTMLRDIGLHLLNDGEVNEDGVPSVDLSSFKIVYVAPMKALVKEVVQSFNKRLGYIPGLKVRELSGDVSMSKREVMETTIVVTTPEKWDIVTRKSNSIYNQVITLLIIDEIHLLHDDRGPVLEAIVARTLREVERTGRQIRIVGLSATLPNFEDVATFLRVRESTGLLVFGPEHRPVPLQQQYIGITERKVSKRLKLMNEITYMKITGDTIVTGSDDVAEDAEGASSSSSSSSTTMSQALVFTHTRKDTGDTAKALLELATERGQPERFLPGGGSDRNTMEILRQEAEECTDVTLRATIPCGIGLHHAGLSRSDRDRVERLFRDKRLNVLCSTATLAWGVNLPAHTVVIKGTQVYDPSKGGHVELSPQDVMQMIGRAGRPGYDSSGEGIIVTTHDEVQFYLSLLNQQLPIESQLGGPRLVDVLNAEIQLGTVTTIREATKWLSYTYLYIRTLRAPKTYKVGLGQESFNPDEDPTLLKHRESMIHTACLRLARCGLIRYDARTRTMSPTPQGRIASHYYLSCDSMRVIGTALRPTLTDIGILRLFSSSHEFINVRTRSSEKLELRNLVGRVPIPIRDSVDDMNEINTSSNGGGDDTQQQQTGAGAAKVNCLLQAYISRLPLKGFALAADMVYVRQSAARLFRALFELTLKRGWSALARRILSWCHMVEKRVWRSATPLRQFSLESKERSGPPVPELAGDLLATLERRGVPWNLLFRMPAHELGELVVRSGQQQAGDSTTRREVGKLLHRKIHQIPRLRVEAQVQPLSRSVLRIELTIQADFQWPIPTIQKGEERTTQSTGGMDFHIMVEDGDGEEILHHERFHLRKKEMNIEHIRTFEVAMLSPTPPQYFIHILSDRWMHSSTVVPVVFRNSMTLPSLNPPPTEMIDLRPILLNSKTRAIDPRHVAVLSSSHTNWNNTLNPMQTQCLPSIYETDQNCLICAPSGSGKSGMAELAMLRSLGFNNSNNATEDEQVSIVYISPNKGRCLQIYESFKNTFGVGLNLNVGALGFTPNTEEEQDREEEKTSSSAFSSVEIMKSNKIIVSTVRAWDAITRDWQRNPLLSSIRLLIFDNLHLLGQEENAIEEQTMTNKAPSQTMEQSTTGSDSASYELTVTRMRFMGAQRNKESTPLRIIGMSHCIANGADVGHWLGCKSRGIHSFTPDISRRTLAPTSVVLKTFDGRNHDSRFNAMGKPTWEAVSTTLKSSTNSGVIIFVPSASQAQTTAIDMITYGMSNDNLLNNSSSYSDDMENDMDDMIVNDETLMELLKHGVGYVHSKQTRKVQLHLYKLMKMNVLKVLVVTPSSAYNMNIQGMETSNDNDADSSLMLSVIIRGCERWSDIDRRYLSYPSSLLSTMSGHASVSNPKSMNSNNMNQNQKVGPVVTVMCHDQNKRYVSSSLTGSTPGAYHSNNSATEGDSEEGIRTLGSILPTVESQIDTSLHDELLSLVSTGACESRQDALDYLTWTFMYRRLPHNPNYYGLSQIDDKGEKVALHLSELIEETMNDLHDSGCIEVGQEDDVVTPMNLGMIAVFYQAEYTTLEIFASSIRKGLLVREALEILTAASEFNRSSICKVRRGEQRELRDAMKYIPMQMNSGLDANTGLYDVHAKSNVLIQTWLNQHHIIKKNDDGTRDLSILSDLNNVLMTSVRLCKALVDVAAQSCQETKGNGSLRSTLVCCELSQLLVQGMLPRDSLLYQIPHFTEEVVNNCMKCEIEDEDSGEKSVVESVLDILDMENDVRENALKSVLPHMNEIASFCNDYPSIDVKYELKPQKGKKNVEAGDVVTLSVYVERDGDEDDEDEDETMTATNPSSQDIPKVMSRFPSSLVEEWWIIVGDPLNDRLMGIKRIKLPVSGAIKKKIKIQVPEIVGANGMMLKMYVVSDSYRGCDDERDIKLL